MKLAILWLLLVAGALALIAAVASHDPAHADPSIVVVGEQNEIAALDLPQLEDATFVLTLDDIPSPIPSVLLLTPSAASNLPDGALRVIAKKGVAIGGLNVTLDELSRLNGTSEERRRIDEILAQAGAPPALPPDPPLFSFSWISCGIVVAWDLEPATRAWESSFSGPFGRRSFDSQLVEMRDLGERCSAFDASNIPYPSNRVVVVGTRDQTKAFAIPALDDALYVDIAQDVPQDDVALVLMTRAGAEASVRYETEPLAVLYNSGIPVVGLDIDRADLLEYTGLIARLRGVSDEVAADFYQQAKWQGQRPVYSHAWRSCPLELDVDQGGSGQMWLGGFGAVPESPPLKTFSMRIEQFRQIGANCIGFQRLQQQAYIDTLHTED